MFARIFAASFLALAMVACGGSTTTTSVLQGETAAATANQASPGLAKDVVVKDVVVNPINPGINPSYFGL